MGVLSRGIKELKFVCSIEGFLDRLVVPEVFHFFAQLWSKYRHCFQLFDGLGFVLQKKKKCDDGEGGRNKRNAICARKGKTDSAMEPK